ncbi:MAG: transcription antitermination factor NusB [Planctomycetaceae bacterium]|jgi:N utilization substance protein B|nr:transcription antitermination factor NusB [Planctomycetaceae bacterium]
MREYEKVNDAKDAPKGKFANRSMVRTVAFQILYQDDQNPGSLDDFGESFLRDELPDHEPLLRFGKALIHGVADRKTELDAAVQTVAQNWAVSRMNPVDRNILRLAAFELLFTETQKPVIINEAIELAKKFGTKDSAAFVNGILDKIGTTPSNA